MPRSIVTTPSAQISGLADNVTSDDFKDKIIKLIPAEVVSAYLGIKGLMESTGESIKNIERVEWILFIILLLLTPILYHKVYNVKGKQLIISTIAFGIWVFSIGGPFDSFFIEDGVLSPSKGFYSGITLILFTLITPLFFPNDETN